MGRATLAPRAGMIAEVPPLRERPLATMKDMGMGAMASGGDAACAPEHAAMGHCTPAPATSAAGDHGAHGTAGGAAMQHSMRDFSVAPQVKRDPSRSEEHTSELQSLLRTSYGV